jgi:hypothetical protein
MYAWEVIGGPFDGPPPGESVMWFAESNGWMTGKIISEPCPVCNQAFGSPVPGEVIE